MKTCALVLVNPTQGQLGHRRSLADTLHGKTILQHTLARLATIPTLDAATLIHANNESLPDFQTTAALPIDRVPADLEASSPNATRFRRVRRAWSVNAWRGGFRGATIWDELFPLAAFVPAIDRTDAHAFLLLAADWCVLDPELNDQLLRKHRENADAMPLCFSQAPPGLAGLVVGRQLLIDLARGQRSIADALAYVPKRPVVDPISQDFNVAIPASVRSAARRFIYDTPESRRRLVQLADHLALNNFPDADAAQITDANRDLERNDNNPRFQSLPPIVDIELTPRRVATGPATPQHHATIERPDLDLQTLQQLAPQLAGHAVTLGGIGEPLLHPHWPRAITACKKADATAVAIQTDLLSDDGSTPNQRAATLIDADPDVIFVRLNAETADTYHRAMGVDRLPEVLETLQALFTQRAARARSLAHAYPFPLIVPTLTKTTDTTPELDHFFERWWQLADHTVIHRFPQGGRGRFTLAPDLNPVPMDPPLREPDPHQTKHRLTVLSNGQLALCQEDWLGRAALGNVHDTPLRELWQTFRQATPPKNWGRDDSPLCRRCHDFTLAQQALNPLQLQAT